MSLPKWRLPGRLKGLTTGLGVTMTTRKGMEGDLATSVLSLLGEKEGGAQKQPCHCCQPFWPCPGPCTPTRYCPPFRGQMVLEHARLLLLEQGLHQHWGLC